MACAVLPDTNTVASGLLAFGDCQARTIGARGYAVMAAPGSTVSQLVTVLLTILIASIGYRLLFGGTPTIRDGVVTAVKIGLVVAFTTNWPAYQVTIYDVAISAPTELATTVAGGVGLPGATGDLAERLDGVDGLFQQLAIYNATVPAADLGANATTPPLFAGFDIFALGAARVTFLVGAVGSYVATRLIAGVMLALGPLFLAFLMFETTSSLVAGWLRVLSGAALGTLVASLILGVQLELFEPWLTRLITQRVANGTLSGAAAPLLATALVFAVCLAAGLAAASRLTWGLRLPWFGNNAASPAATWTSRGADTSPSQIGATAAKAGAERSRAIVVADAVAAADRRDAVFVRGGAHSSAPGSSVRGPASQRRSDADGTLVTTVTAAVGQRRSGTRTSGSAQRRDRR